MKKRIEKYYKIKPIKIEIKYARNVHWKIHQLKLPIHNVIYGWNLYLNKEKTMGAVSAVGVMKMKELEQFNR